MMKKAAYLLDCLSTVFQNLSSGLIAFIFPLKA